MSHLTFKFRVKDATTGKALKRHAWAVNQVWNFCVATQREAEKRRRGGFAAFWPSAIDLGQLTVGVGADLGIHSDTVSMICRQFAKSRDQFRKCPRFRASNGPKQALGWIPFVPRAVKIDGDAAVYLKRCYRFWRSRDVGPDFRTGAFVQDARGRWYIAVSCVDPAGLAVGNGQVGIDLGLKDLATLSNGDVVPALQHYRRYQAALGVAQRANNKRRVKAIHAKIANARRHHLHEQSTRIARENALIVVGNVNAAGLAKTSMAKSVLDAGWSSFRYMLRYKASRHGAVFIEADERFSSQTCSTCGTLPASRPRGIAGLGIRRWECSDCGASHDRDVNAAMNILRVGLECQPPVGGIPVH